MFLNFNGGSGGNFVKLLRKKRIKENVLKIALKILDVTHPENTNAH